jgi:hypothetical protein
LERRVPYSDEYGDKTAQSRGDVMERAAVLIGVNRTGQLQTLNAAVDGAKKMARWAAAQGIPDKRIFLIVDEEVPVTVGRIKSAIQSIIQLQIVEQLVVYFAGHGIYTNQSEFWLLSQAPGDPDEAVNVARSQDMARVGSVAHVVFISDACRTSATGPPFNAVFGCSIFPSPAYPARPERSVDLFFACGFDCAALEVIDLSQSNHWTSVYTDTLYEALNGDFPSVLDSWTADGQVAALVTPQRLKPFLARTVPERMIAAGLTSSAIQTPDARVCSPASAWISFFLPPPPSFGAMFAGIAGGAFRKSASRNVATEVDLAIAAVRKSLVYHDIDPLEIISSWTVPGEDPGSFHGPRSAPISIGTFARYIGQAEDQAFKNAAIKCGFAFSGAQPCYCAAIGATGSIKSMNDSTIEIDTQNIIDVAIELNDGRGTILPAIPGHVATLVFQQGRLLAVSWQRTDANDAILRSQRALTSALERRGAFQFDREYAAELAEWIQSARDVDLSMAIYACYAFYDLQAGPFIGKLKEVLWEKLSFDSVDLALISRPSISQSELVRSGIRFPLLSRGWSLLTLDSAEAAGIPLLARLYPYLSSSQWTLFEPAGMVLLRESLAALGLIE